MLNNGKKNNGFTLLEVMISIAIFTIIGLGAYRIFDVVITSQSRITEHSESLRQWQRAMLLLSSDIEQLVNRPVRAEYGDEKGALLVDEDYFLEFTRQGWRNPLDLKRSNLQRVAYSLGSITGDKYLAGDSDSKKVHLLRHYWPVLDRPQDARPVTQLLIDDVIDMRVRIYGDDGNWHNAWPVDVPGSSNQIIAPFTASVPAKTVENSPDTIKVKSIEANPHAELTAIQRPVLPVTIEIIIESQALGEIKRIFQTGTLKRAGGERN